MKYRTLWVVRHDLPDDRLAHAQIEIRDGEGLVTLSLRSGMLHDDLAQAMADFSEAFARTGLYELEPEQPTFLPELQAWFQRVGDNITGDQPMRIYVGGTGPRFFEVLVNRELASRDLLKEMNEEVLPTVCGLLVPAGYLDRSSSVGPSAAG